MVQLRAARRPAVRHRQAQRFLGAAHHVHRGVGPDGGGAIITTTSSSMRAPGMSLDRMPLFVWAMLVTVVHDHVRDARGDAREHDADHSTAWSARTSSTRPKAATRSCGSTSSGSSAIRRSTSSSFPALGDRLGDHPDVRAPAGVRLSGDRAVAHRDRLPGVRAVGAPHVRDRRARARQELLHRREHDDRDPDRNADLLLDRDAVDWSHRSQDAAAVTCSASSSS